MPFTPVHLPSGRWQGGFRHPVTGKKITLTHDYEWEAEAWAITAEARAKASTDTTTDITTATVERPQHQTRPEIEPVKWIGPTVGDYGASYLRRRAGEIERATRSKYASWLTGLAANLTPGTTGRAPLADVPMGLLTKSDVQEWLTDSREAGIGRPTINGRLRLLRMLYVDLLDSDDAPPGVRNPTRTLGFLTEETEGTDHVLTAGEESELLGTMAGLGLDQLRMACLVAIDAGARWQEVYALTANAVAGQYLVISHAIERGTRDPRKFTKGKRPRVVPMTARLETDLAPWVAAARKTKSGLLFPAYSQGNRTAPEVRAWDYSNHRKRQWLPALFAVGAAEEKHSPTGRFRTDGTEIMQRRLVEPAYGFHALRHTYGSRLAAAGVARAEIAKLMGHADERITSRYIHSGDDGRRLDLVRSVERSRAA